MDVLNNFLTEIGFFNPKNDLTPNEYLILFDTETQQLSFNENQQNIMYFNNSSEETQNMISTYFPDYVSRNDVVIRNVIPMSSILTNTQFLFKFIYYY